MSKWTDQLPEAAKDYIAGRRVDEIECVIGDIAGVARGKAEAHALALLEKVGVAHRAHHRPAARLAG